MLSADNLQKARFTEVIRDVRVSKANATEMREAKVNDNFEVPEVIRTGMNSRAELEAPDKTIARIGANTVFSFEAAKRTMNLQSGSVLFHAPKGMGGGIIKTAAATAAVTGTTIMVGATSNGGFKLMVMEGSSRVTLPSGSNKVLKEGQMTFIMPGRDTLGPTLEFDLQRTVQGSDLVNGFDKEVSSKTKIDKAIGDQQQEIKSGKVSSTETELVDAVNNNEIVVIDLSKNQELANPVTNTNSFPLLSSFLDSQIGADLSFDTLDLSGKNVFLSSIPAQGTYKGFGINAAANYAAVGGKNITFTLTNYDFSRFGTLSDFGIFANGTITFPFGPTTFSNIGNSIHFINVGGAITFTQGATLNFSASNVSFESLGDITHTSTGNALTIQKVAGDLTRLVMESKTGKIDLAYPIFNSAVTELRADTVNLSHLNMANYTGTKSLNVYTKTGNWYYIGTGGVLPNNSGSLNIYGDNGQNGPTNGGPGTQVNDGTTTYNINSYINGP